MTIATETTPRFTIAHRKQCKRSDHCPDCWPSASTESAGTPRPKPWEVRVMRAGSGDVEVLDANGERVLLIGNARREAIEECVRAVNRDHSFEAMRDALKAANKWIAEASEECEDRGFFIGGDVETQNQIEAALKLAVGGQQP